MKWSANNTDIVNFAVFAENRDNKVKKTVIVERDSRIALIPDVDFSLPYNVTVVIYNKCQKQYSSVYPLYKSQNNFMSSIGISAGMYNHNCVTIYPFSYLIRHV